MDSEGAWLLDLAPEEAFHSSPCATAELPLPVEAPESRSSSPVSPDTGQPQASKRYALGFSSS